MFNKFKQWMKFDPPVCNSPSDWVEFDNEYKTKAPMRYFLTKTLPYITWKPIVWKIERIGDWVRYRIVRYHILDTGLAPGYHDKSSLMLYVNFQLLVDYVEHELPAQASFTDCGAEKKFKWLRNLPYPFETTIRELSFRNRDAGIAHLDWEATLDAPGLAGNLRSEMQAQSAREVKELYIWWKDIRPLRDIDEMPKSVSKILNEHDFLYIMAGSFKKDYPEEHRLYLAWSQANQEDDEYYELEDEENLMRLIKLRNRLWT